jgi:hypothetical protein
VYERFMERRSTLPPRLLLIQIGPLIPSTNSPRRRVGVRIVRPPAFSHPVRLTRLEQAQTQSPILPHRDGYRKTPMIRLHVRMPPLLFLPNRLPMTPIPIPTRTPCRLRRISSPLSSTPSLSAL